MTVLPIEVKSGKDYRAHSALNRFLATPDYNIHEAVVFSNEQRVYNDSGIVYLPIYYCVFFDNSNPKDKDCIIPEITLPEI